MNALNKRVFCFVISGIQYLKGDARRMNSSSTATRSPDAAWTKSCSIQLRKANLSRPTDMSTQNSGSFIKRCAMNDMPSFRVVSELDAPVVSSVVPSSATIDPSTTWRRVLVDAAPFISTFLKCAEL